MIAAIARSECNYGVTWTGGPDQLRVSRTDILGVSVQTMLNCFPVFDLPCGYSFGVIPG